MKFLHLLLLITAFGLISNIRLLGDGLEYYDFINNSDNNHIVVIPNVADPKIGTESLAIGDEIGVFTPSGTCVGGVKWEGISTTITVYGYSQQSNPNGAKPGDEIIFRVWEKSSNTEYTSVTVVWDQDDFFLNHDGKYAINGFSGISSLVAAKKPGIATFTNPTDNEIGVSLSGNLSWNAAAGAETHTIQLSNDANFSTTIINSTGQFTSIGYSGLNYNTMYYARVLGTNDEGEGDWKTISFKTLLESPVLTSPADNAKGLDERDITLVWNSVSGADSYNILVSTSADFLSNVDDYQTNDTQINIAVSDNFTNYYWKVQAQSNDGNISAFSSVRNFTTRVGVTTIIYPANQSAGVPVSGMFEWTAVAGASSYDVELLTPPSQSVMTINVNGTSTPYNNLGNFTDYMLIVTAKNADGMGDMASSEFKTVVASPVLNTPLNDSYKNQLDGILNWEAVNGADSYDLILASDAAFISVIANVGDLNGTSYNYSGLNHNTKYFWKVRAKNADGISDYSQIFSFTTVLGSVVLSTPADESIQVVLNPTLTWMALDGANNYHVQVSTSPIFANLIYENTTVNGTDLEISNLNGKTTYYWRVKGYSPNNEGVFSDAFMFTTQLAKVTLLSPVNNAQGLLADLGTLSWALQSGATAYDLLISTNSDLSSPIVDETVNTNSYDYTGLDNNTSYYWAVRAVDNDGVGEYSDTWSFGTQLNAPILLTPLDEDVDVVLQGTCTWTEVADADSYEIQIATDDIFNNILFTQTGIVDNYTDYTGLENNSVHYWRVRAYKGNGAGLWSSTFSFTTMTLSPPSLVFPPNNSIDLFTEVNFIWNQIPDAVAYNLRIATDKDFANIVAQVNNIVGTDYSVTNLFEEREFYWQVQTIGQQGLSNWSAAYKFNTFGDPVLFGDNSFCEGRHSVYHTTSSPLIDYNWVVTGGEIVGPSAGEQITVLWGEAGEGSVKVIRTSAVWGNYSDFESMDVTITAKQVIDVAVSANTYNDGYACRNEWVHFNSVVNSNGIFTYSWFLDGVLIGTSPELEYHFTDAGSYTFKFVVDGMDCEGGEAEITVDVHPDCPVTIINDDHVSSCKGASPVLETKVIGGSGQFDFTWTPAGDFVDNTVESPVIIASNLSKTYKLTLIDVVENNTYIDFVDVVVWNSPSVSTSPAALTVRNSNPVDLTDPSVLTTNINGGTAPYFVNWSYKDGTPVDPTHVQPVIGTNRFIISVTDANGCTSNPKNFIILRTPRKDDASEFITGMTGDGYMLTYPNPVVDDLNIIINSDNPQMLKIKVLDLLGQEVYKGMVNSGQIYEGTLSLSELSPGAYMLIVESDVNTFVKTFMKQ